MTESFDPADRQTVDFRPTPPPILHSSESEAAFSLDPRVVELVQDYLNRLEKGESPDRRAYIERYPELSAVMTECLEGLEMVHAGLKNPEHRPASGVPELADAGQPEILPESLGDFRIVRELARGGMGIVYEAKQLSLGRRVALKVLPFAATLDARQLQRFKTEAQAAALLHHTNIVPVYAVGCERGVHFYAMQLIDGQSLAELIEQLRRQAGFPILDDSPSRGPVHSSYVLGNDLSPPSSTASRAQERVAEPAEKRPTAPSTASQFHAALSTQHASRDAKFFQTAARLMLQASQALEHAHEYGVVHRDIKPANLLLDVQGILWVADFGLAQFHAETGLTRTGDVLGTLRYMSPEQAAGKKMLVDGRTDVYSLGATFYEFLTLTPIFEGREVQTILNQVLHAEPRPLRQIDKSIPVELETIILKSVSKSPDDRYRTASDLSADLLRYLSHQPILARRPSLADRVRKWSRRHPSIVISTLLVMAVVAVALLISNRREQLRANEAEKRFQQARQVVDSLIQFSEEELADKPFMDGTRQRLLGIVLGYYQDFVDQSKGKGNGQSDFERVQERVQTILSELALLRREMQRGALEHKVVLDDLSLTESQRERLDALLKQWKDDRERMAMETGTLDEETRRRTALAIAVEHDRAVELLLSTQQRQRLAEIALQEAGIMAFRDPDVATKLNLTAAQRKSIREIEREIFRPFFEPGGPGGGHGRGPRGGGPPKISKKDSVAKVLALLNSDQVARWQEMIGPPFAGLDKGPPWTSPPRSNPSRDRPPPGGKTKHKPNLELKED